MQGSVWTRRSRYPLKFGNIGKLLIMDSAPSHPHAVSVGVQHDGPTLDPLHVASHPLASNCSSSASCLPHCLANGTGDVDLAPPDQTLLPDPLKPQLADPRRQLGPRASMEDSTTTTEEYDMADGLGKPTPPSDSVSDSDSLESTPPGSPRGEPLAMERLEKPRPGSDHSDRVSVDLADLSLSAGNEPLPRGVSEASDSGFSRSCGSDSPEKDSESGASDKSAPGPVFAPPTAEAASEAAFESASADEGVDLAPATTMNGRAEPHDHADADAEPLDERRNSSGSLDDSVASSQSSSARSAEPGPAGTQGGADCPVQPAPAASARGPRATVTSVRRSGAAAQRRPAAQGAKDTKETETATRNGRRGRVKFAHITPRIDSGRQAPPKAKPEPAIEPATEPTPEPEQGPEAEEPEAQETMPEAQQQPQTEAEVLAAPPAKKRVHFETGADGDDEEEFVIHPGPGFDDGAPEPPPRIVSFQEPRSLVKQYIRGRPGSSTRPRIVKQTTVEVAELARRPQRAIPMPSSCGAAPNIPVKQTIASKKRLEKLRQESQALMERLQAESAYMTPLQRKEAEVKELKRQLGEAYFIIEQREVELDVFHHEKEREIRDVVEEKDDQLKEMEESVEILQDELDASKAENTELAERQTQMEEYIKELKTEAEKRELRHQNLYLQMYRKGRDSALFEREDELEKLALEEPDKVSKEELLKKLEHTQHELEHWQRVKLTEHYDEAAKPETEADAMLKFLKDSMFHYLTESRKEAVDQHLKAIIQIFQFTEVQMRSINKSVEERKRKGKM